MWHIKCFSYHLIVWCENNVPILSSLIFIYTYSRSTKHNNYFGTTWYGIRCELRWTHEYATVTFVYILYMNIKFCSMSIINQPSCDRYLNNTVPRFKYMGQVKKLWLSCYLVLLSIGSKPGNKTAEVSWPDPYHVVFSCQQSALLPCIEHNSTQYII